MEKSVLYLSESNSVTIFDRVITYLNAKYHLRFNNISLEYEIKPIAEKIWSELNLNSLLIELIQSGIEISIAKLEILIRSHLIENYDPIKYYFESINEWDRENHIQQLAKYIKTTDDEAFAYHLEKWLTRAVLCALEEEKVNKQAFILTSSVQNLGKTSFLRFLIPQSLKKYYSENISVDKDGQIALCKNLILNADELSVFSKTDINSLKSFISKSSVNVRLPYGRKSSYMERRCSFVGSTNKTDFLTDETGSVRWLIFEVFDIDFTYSSQIEIDKVWSQAYYNAYYRRNYNPDLTPKDIAENEKRNERFSQITMEQEVVSAYFEKSESPNDFLTATDIVVAMNSALGIKLNNVRVGKALSKLKIERIKHCKNQIYGYLLKRKL
ncbi:MAG: VapE family protein [Cruoricaptor ignavus]|nr:VapE family protein [Cruoricaptor ignavus]